MKRLDEIEARTNAATPGPWEAGCNDRHMHYATTENEEFCNTYGPELYDSQGFFSEDDTEFIAHARTDVPALVAALRAVIGLHRIIRVGGAGGVTYEVCQNCNQPAPCAYIQTIRQHLGEDA